MAVSTEKKFGICCSCQTRQEVVRNAALRLEPHEGCPEEEEYLVVRHFSHGTTIWCEGGSAVPQALCN